jgi:tetratricopeptide (TPR) repeat protein
MDEHADARGPHVRSEVDDIVRLQTLLARRVLLIFAVPLLVIVVLGGYAYQLSSRVATLEVSQRNDEALRRINVAERIMQKTPTLKWAIHEYEQVAKEYPHPQVLVRLGALYYADGRLREALKMLEEAKKTGPEYWEIYSTAAYIYVDQHKVEQAMQAGEKALELNPWDAQTYNNLAWLYLTNDQVRDLAKALKYAVTAVAYTRGHDPEALDTLDRLLDAYANNGHIDRAIVMMEGMINHIHQEGVKPEFFQMRVNALRELQASVREE